MRRNVCMFSYRMISGCGFTLRLLKVSVCSSDTAGSPLQLVCPAVPSLLPLLQVFPLGCEALRTHMAVSVRHNLLLLLLLLLLLHQVSFLPLVLPFPFPNLLAELVHAVQSRVVDQRQEVSVPQLLGWTLLRRGALLGGWIGGLLIAMQQILQALGVNDF